MADEFQIKKAPPISDVEFKSQMDFREQAKVDLETAQSDPGKLITDDQGEKQVVQDPETMVKAKAAAHRKSLAERRQKYPWTESPIKRAQESFKQRFIEGEELPGPDMPFDYGLNQLAEDAPEAAAGFYTGAVGGTAATGNPLVGAGAGFVGLVVGGTYGQIKDWANESEKTSQIWQKAKNDGYSALSEDEKSFLRANTSTDEQRRIYAETSGSADNLTPEEIAKLSLQQEWYEKQAGRRVDEDTPPFYLRREILNPEWPGAEKREQAETRKTVGELSPLSETIIGVGRWLNEIGTDVDEDYLDWKRDWERRAAEIPADTSIPQQERGPFGEPRNISQQETERILGIDREQELLRQQEKQAAKDIIKLGNEFTRAMEEADKRKLEETGERLSPTMRDMPKLSFVNPNDLSFDLGAMRSRMMPGYMEEVRQELFNENPDVYGMARIGSPTKDGWVRTIDPEILKDINTVRQEAIKRWEADRNYILAAGKGLAFYDPDYYGSLEKQKQKAIALRDTDSLFLQSLQAAPGLIAPYDIALPWITAFTPRYSLHLSDTHAEFASHRVMDIVNGMFIDNWWGAALKTYEERRFGYVDPETGEHTGFQPMKDAPVQGEEVPQSEKDLYKGPDDERSTIERLYGNSQGRPLFEDLTYEDILKGSESQTLADITEAWGRINDKSPGFGLMALFLQPTSPVFPTAEELEGTVRQLATSYVEFTEIKRGLGDDEEVERYLHNIRKGTLLFQSYDSLASRYSKAIGADPGTETALRRMAILTGLSTMVTQGPGTDPVTPVVAATAKGLKQARRFKASFRQDPKFLSKLADDTTARPSEKIQKVKRRDRVLGESIEEETRVDLALKQSSAARAVDAAEISAEISEREAWMLSQEAGMFSSPAVLPGARLVNPKFQERWVQMETQRVMDQAEGIGAKITEKEATEQARTNLTAHIDEAIERIRNNTVDGDVYLLNGQQYIRVRGLWIPAEGDDVIQVVRSALREIGEAQPGQERFRRARIREEAWTEKTGTDVLGDSTFDDVTRMRRLDFEDIKTSEIPDAPVEFATLGAKTGLAPDDSVEFIRSIAADAIEDTNVLTAREMVGAQASNVRNPWVRGADRPQWTPAGSTQQAAAKAQEDALRQQLAAKQLRAGEARADFEELSQGTGAAYESLTATRKQLHDVNKELDKLEKAAEKVDVRDSADFKAWAELRARADRLQAEYHKAHTALQADIGKRTKLSRDPISIRDALKIEARRKKRYNKAKKAYDEAAKAANEAAAPIQAKMDEYKRLYAEMAGLAQKKAVLKIAAASMEEAYDKPWKNNAYGASKIFDETGEASGYMDELLARLEKEATELEAEAAFAERKLQEHLLKSGVKSSLQEAQEFTARMTEVTRATQQEIRAKARSEVLNNVLRKRSTQILQGTRALNNNKFLEEAIEDAIEVATVRVDKAVGGKRVIDSRVVLHEVTEAVGEEALDHAIKNGGDIGRLLQNLRDASLRPGPPRPSQVVEGVPIKSKLDDARFHIELDGSETRLLYDLPKVLRNSWRESHPHKDSINAVKALELAKQDKDLKASNFFIWLGRAVRPAFDPVRSKTGIIADDLVDVAKSVEHMHGHIRDEMDALARYIDKQAKEKGWSPARQEKALIQLYLKYLDTDTPLEVMRARATFFNEGSESIWTQARFQMLHDPRGQGMRHFTKNSEEWSAQFKKENGRPPTRAELEEYLKEKFGAEAKALESVEALPLRAISRAWIPEYGWGGASEGQAIRAYNQAYDALRDSTSLKQFFDEVRNQSTRNFGKPSLNLKAIQHAAYAIAHGSVQFRANKLVARASGFADPAAVRDISRFFSKEMDKVEDFDRMIETMNQFGLPFTQSKARRATGTTIFGAEGGLTSKELVATGVERVPAGRAEIPIEKPFETWAGDPIAPGPMVPGSFRPDWKKGGEYTWKTDPFEVPTYEDLYKTGKTFFMPQTLAKTIDDAMPKVTKELEKRYVRADSPAEVMEFLPQMDYNRLWKTSIVTGLFVPRPKYFWNNFIGDFSQVWFEQGFGTAASMSSQLVGRETFNFLGANVPGSKLLKEFHLDMAKKYGYDKTLGSTWNALMNPHANKIWRGEKGVLRTRYGAEYQYEEVRKMLQEEGIMDTMVHEELLSTFARHVPDSWTNAPWKGAADILDDQRHNISWLAVHVQQRQRGNLFMELLRQGYKPKDAARKTKEALYDWKHALTRWETLTIGKVSPFYRFWRLAFGQTARRALEPLTKPNKAIYDAIQGKSALSRFHQMTAGFESIPGLMDPEIANQMMTEGELLDHAAKYYRPSWARSRFLSHSRRMDAVEMEHYFRTRRRIVTHAMGIMPPVTQVDVSEMGGSLMLGLLAGSLSMLEAKGYQNPYFKVAPGFEERIWQPTLQMLVPWVAGPMDSFFKDYGVETGSYNKRKQVRVTPYEAEILQRGGMGVTTLAGAGTMAAMGALGGGRFKLAKTAIGAGIGGGVGAYVGDSNIGVRESDQVLVADAASVAMLRSTPFYGAELGGLFNAFYGDNPYARKLELQKNWNDESVQLLMHAAKHGFGTFTGPGQTYGFAPRDRMRWEEEAQRRTAEQVEETRFASPPRQKSAVFKGLGDE